MKIKDIPNEERPRERLKEVGAANLTNKELLSIILKSGTKNKNVSELALELLKKYELVDFRDINLYDLTKIIGIGEVKAIELLASIEFGKRIFLKKGKKLMKLDNPKTIWESSKYLFTGLKQEHFYCYYFNNKQELIERKLIFMGTLNQATTHTREIFKEAYKVSASSIICLHNHPSNDTTPSRADKLFTERLMKTGAIQGIPVIDHIIVGENSFYSFYEHSNTLNIWLFQNRNYNIIGKWDDNMYKKKTKNKRIIVITITIAIVMLSLSIILNRRTGKVETLAKDVATVIEKAVMYPFTALNSDKNTNQNESYIIQKNVNTSLEKEIKELKEVLELNKTLTGYEPVNATILTRNKSYWFNTISIDKGKNSGLKENMAVITKNGLIGKLSKVYDNSSEVKLITTDDINFKVSIAIKTNEVDNYAILSGYDKKTGYIKATGIDKTTEINKGDKVLTSGLGEMFPAGIYIGTVEKIESDKYNLSKNIYVKTYQNFNDIHYVTVLKAE